MVFRKFNVSGVFAASGREYDKDGVLKPWWESDVITRFNETAQCFVEQYSKYTVNGEHVSIRAFCQCYEQCVVNMDELLETTYKHCTHSRNWYYNLVPENWQQFLEFVSCSLVSHFLVSDSGIRN